MYFSGAALFVITSLSEMRCHWFTNGTCHGMLPMNEDFEPRRQRSRKLQFTYMSLNLRKLQESTFSSGQTVWHAHFACQLFNKVSTCFQRRHHPCSDIGRQDKGSLSAENSIRNWHQTMSENLGEGRATSRSVKSLSYLASIKYSLEVLRLDARAQYEASLSLYKGRRGGSLHCNQRT